MKFTMNYWKDDGWYVGKIKEVPGVFSQGETLEELTANIQDAYRLIMEDDTVFPSGEIQTAEIHLSVA
jgi:predicted RNase H-like HicB family nuclease